MSGYPDSYYVATAQGLLDAPALAGEERADVCVIGGGYTGLSTALHLSERGYSVVLLEAERVGWGASGRNGGHVGSGQRRDEADLEALVGRAAARLLWDLGEEAKQLVKDLVARHSIDCDLGQGQVLAAAKPAHLEDLAARVRKLREDYDYAHMRIVPREELREMVATDRYHGGCLDADAAHLHPLNYALGLARACRNAGVRIYEGSRVQSYSIGRRARVHATGGHVDAEFVVLACNAYLGRLEPRVAGRIMPINNFMLATAPLGAERAQALLRERVCVHDTLFVLNYFRLSADGRLLFGGGENYTSRFPRDLKSFVRRHMLQVFPQLADVPVDYAWGGALAITLARLPHFGRLDRGIYFAHGYSGHGVPTATLAGRLVAEAIAGTAERFDLIASLPIRRFPGGTLLRWPGMVLGMLYYALRDRL